MSNLIWGIFLFLLAVLAVSLIWFIWRLRHFSQSNHQTVLDDKLLRNMLGDEALSKNVKNALVNNSAGVPVSGAREDQPDSSEELGTEKEQEKK